MTTLFTDTNKGATFSPCRKYRYALWRIWDAALPAVAFVGLNPSTANEDSNDPTIKSVIRLAKYNGYGGAYMLNCHAIIGADPAILREPIDLQGENYEIISALMLQQKFTDIVFAWGAFKEAKETCQRFVKAYPYALCIGKNANGSPKHPLFQKGETQLVRYNEGQL